MSSQLAAELAKAPAFRGVKDVDGLLTLRNQGIPEADIIAWSRWGSLEPAWRLSSLGVTAAQAGPTIMRSGGTTGGYLRVVQAALALGVQPEDVSFWVSAGVFSLTGEPVDAVLFARWRSFAVTWVGMRQAALVAAAGITIHEAIGMRERGEFDGAVVAIMAQLNL
ncbi:MAG: hypothetical protein ACOH1Y_14845 [Propionicimonas sp.]